MDCKLKLLDGWCDVADISATAEQVSVALETLEELYAQYIDFGIDRERALAMTALKLASTQVEPLTPVSDTRQFNVNICLNGVKLQLRVTSNKVYIYRKAAKIVNNNFSEIKRRYTDPQESWLRLVLELALATNKE